MKLRAEVLEPGEVTASVISDEGGFPVRNAPMKHLGEQIFELDFEAEPRYYVLLVDLDGVRYLSQDFWGCPERADPEPQEIVPMKDSPAGVAFSGTKPRRWR